MTINLKITAVDMPSDKNARVTVGKPLFYDDNGVGIEIKTVYTLMKADQTVNALIYDDMRVTVEEIVLPI